MNITSLDAGQSGIAMCPVKSPHHMDRKMMATANHFINFVIIECLIYFLKIKQEVLIKLRFTRLHHWQRSSLVKVQ